MASLAGLDGTVLGIDFGGSKVALAAADLAGRVLHEERLVVRRDAGAEDILDETVEAARRLLVATVGERPGPVRAVGVATPGIPTSSGVLLSPNLPGWDELDLEGRLRDAFGVDAIRVRNDVKCAALAELRWGALRDVDPGIYLNLGTGVGAALAVEGTVVEGAHGGAGEIGYAKFWAPPGGGVKTSLEELVGGRALEERAGDLLGRQLGAAELFESDDPPVRDLVDTALAGLAAHLGNLVLALDPACVAIGGGLMGHSARILASLRGGLAIPSSLSPRLVAARFRHDASLQGAIAFALEAVRAD